MSASATKSATPCSRQPPARRGRAADGVTRERRGGSITPWCRARSRRQRRQPGLARPAEPSQSTPAPRARCCAPSWGTAHVRPPCRTRRDRPARRRSRRSSSSMASPNTPASASAFHSAGVMRSPSGLCSARASVVGHSAVNTPRHIAARSRCVLIGISVSCRSPPVGGHSVAALGDHVAQHLVGAAAEAHQRRHPVEAFEQAGQRRVRAAMRHQPVGPQQIDRQIGDALAQFAGEDLLDADLDGGDARRCRASTRPRSPSACATSTSASACARRRRKAGSCARHRPVAHAAGRPVRSRSSSGATQIARVGQRTAFQIQRAGDVGPAHVDLADQVGRPVPARRGRTSRWCDSPTTRTAGGSRCRAVDRHHDHRDPAMARRRRDRCAHKATRASHALRPAVPDLGCR